MDGYFIVSYRIGGDMPGAPIFTVHLGVDTAHKEVRGDGEVTQAVNPPLRIRTMLSGTFTYMCVMPKECKILVKLGGVPAAAPSEHPPGLLNTDLHMVLNDDWKSGTASYRYRDDSGQWVEITDAPVEQIDIPINAPAKD